MTHEPEDPAHGRDGPAPRACVVPRLAAGTILSGGLHLVPRLSGDALLGTEFEKYPDTTRLKLDRLVPMMSESLGLGSFSIITRRGFGCCPCYFGPNGPMFGH